MSANPVNQESFADLFEESLARQEMRQGEVITAEVVRIEVKSRADVLAGNSDGADVVTADASLVIADWLLRNGHVPVDSPARMRIARLGRGEAL